jgi:hypothetical protein
MKVECCGRRLEWRSRRGPYDDHDVEQAKCPECSVQYERRPGFDRFYVTNERSRTCSACGGPVHNAPVSHPVHLYGEAEPGQCKYELIPCCDLCDTRPLPVGTPIFANFRPSNRLAEAS